MKNKPDAAYFRTVGARRGLLRRMAYYFADKKLAALFDNVPVPAGKQADYWMKKCLAWVWKNVVPCERDPLAEKPTTEEVLRGMATHCEGYATLIVDMAHAALDVAAWDRIRYVTGYKAGFRHHAWAQWQDSEGKVWMLDAGVTSEPIAGTNGWTVDAETIVIARPIA